MSKISVKKMKRKVSLVLGGGGARGLTHIGVIEALEERGYEIVSISGTSIGAVVGGVYCSGKINDYRKWVESLSRFDVIKLLDFSFSSGGIIKGDKIINKLQEIVDDVNIEDLNLIFTAVATDLTNKKEFWFRKGKLLTAVRASMAIPSIFTPVKIDTRTFVDGGVVNPVPVTPTLSDESDLTIAVSLDGDAVKTGLPKLKEEGSLFEAALKYLKLDGRKDDINYVDVTEASISILQNSIGRYKIASTPPDILLEIPSNICGLFDYHRAKELIAFGKEKMINKLENTVF